MRPVILACFAFLLAIVVGAFHWQELRLAALKAAAENPKIAVWEIEDAIFVRPGRISDLQSPRSCLSAEAGWYIDKLSGETMTGINLINHCAEPVEVTDLRTMLPIIGTYASALPVKALIAPLNRKHGVKDLREKVFFFDKGAEACKDGMFTAGARCKIAPAPSGHALFIEMLLPAKDGFIIETADGKKLTGKFSAR
ncbi:MAG: hypothetical protein ACAH80_15690 [Alphaproteobacteria bacterium]